MSFEKLPSVLRVQSGKQLTTVPTSLPDHSLVQPNTPSGTAGSEQTAAPTGLRAAAKAAPPRLGNDLVSFPVRDHAVAVLSHNPTSSLPTRIGGGGGRADDPNPLPAGIPNHLSSQRWPWMSDAIRYCVQAAEDFPTPDKFQWKDLPEDYRNRIGLYNHPLSDQIEKLSKANREENLQIEDASNNHGQLRNKLARDLHEARQELGFDKIINPLTVGHSYLTYWPTGQLHVSENGEPGSRISGEPAIIIAPSLPMGAIQQGVKLVLFNAIDLGRQDAERDYICTTLQCDVVILSLEQCRAWGLGMMAKGRIYFDYRPAENQKNESRRKR